MKSKNFIEKYSVVEKYFPQLFNLFKNQLLNKTNIRRSVLTTDGKIEYSFAKYSIIFLHDMISISPEDYPILDAFNTYKACLSPTNTQKNKAYLSFTDGKMFDGDVNVYHIFQCIKEQSLMLVDTIVSYNAIIPTFDSEYYFYYLSKHLSSLVDKYDNPDHPMSSNEYIEMAFIKSTLTEIDNEIIAMNILNR